MPDYYIRGSITQMDDNTVRKNKGIGFSLPFLDLGASKDDGYDLLSMDISIGDAATRKIIPVTSTSNTLVLSKGGVAGEGGGKIGKLGLSFNIDISRSEGVGAATRTLVELGLIEALGKFTQVPYWKCLDTDLTNPLIQNRRGSGTTMPRRTTASCSCNASLRAWVVMPVPSTESPVLRLRRRSPSIRRLPAWSPMASSILTFTQAFSMISRTRLLRSLPLEDRSRIMFPG